MKNDLSPISALESRIDYLFTDQALLQEALTHRSALNEPEGRGSRDNERLEFLGDAVLGLLVGELLFDRFADKREGELSRLRASLVREENLARLARQLELGRHLIIGKGEERTGGRDRDSVLADAFEAVIAAVYRDGGMDQVRQMVAIYFVPLIEAGASANTVEDFKTRLQELVQSQSGETPVYQLVATSGPDHERLFTVQVVVAGEVAGEGRGTSRKRAEQEAAQSALQKSAP